MAKAETNQRKREEIKAIMTAVFERGWTALILAAYTRHTTSCISSWKLGKSMGTNAERAMLQTLPVVSDPTVGEELEDSLRAAKKELVRTEAELASYLSPAKFQKTCAQQRSAIKSYLEGTRNAIKGASSEDDRAYFQKQADKYEALLSDQAALEAYVRDEVERWSKVSGARQAHKDAEAALNAWEKIPAVKARRDQLDKEAAVSEINANTQ